MTPSNALRAWVLLALVIAVTIAVVLWPRYNPGDRAGSDARASLSEDNGSYPSNGPESPRQGSARTGASASSVGPETAGSVASPTPRPSGGIGQPASYCKPGYCETPTLPPSSVSGIASTYGPGWDGWIAWPEGPGYILRVCGAGGCRTVTSTDAGPDKAMQRAGRVIDLDVPTFEAVCGVHWTQGLCNVTVVVLGRNRG